MQAEGGRPPTDARSVAGSSADRTGHRQGLGGDRDRRFGTAGTVAATHRHVMTMVRPRPGVSDAGELEGDRWSYCYPDRLELVGLVGDRPSENALDAGVREDREPSANASVEPTGTRCRRSFSGRWIVRPRVRLSPDRPRPSQAGIGGPASHLELQPFPATWAGLEVDPFGRTRPTKGGASGRNRALMARIDSSVRAHRLRTSMPTAS